MPTAELSETDFKDGVIDIITLVHLSGLCATRSEARRNIQQGGVSVDGELVKDIARTYPIDAFKDGLVVKRGKKNFRKVTVK